MASCVTPLIISRRSEQNWYHPNPLTSGADSPVRVDLRASVDHVVDPRPRPTTPPHLVLEAACLKTTTDLSRPNSVITFSKAEEAATATLCNTGAHRGYCDPLAGHPLPWPRRHLRPSGPPRLAQGRTGGPRCGSLHSILPSSPLKEDVVDHLAAMTDVPSSIPNRAPRLRQRQAASNYKNAHSIAFFLSS